MKVSFKLHSIGIMVNGLVKDVYTRSVMLQAKLTNLSIDTEAKTVFLFVSTVQR